MISSDHAWSGSYYELAIDGDEVHTREAELFDRRYGELAVDGVPVGCVVRDVLPSGLWWIPPLAPHTLRENGVNEP
jgi:hypothetical protein